MAAAPDAGPGVAAPASPYVWTSVNMGQDAWSGSAASSALAYDNAATYGAPTPGSEFTASDAVTWFQQAVAPLLGDQVAQPAPASGVQAPDYSKLATMAHPDGTAVVQIGDSLPKIAQRYLGDASRWPEIYNLNRDQILTPDVILPGMVLKLPTGPKPANPPAPPPPRPPVSRPAQPAQPSTDPTQLEKVTPQQLAYLGQNDKARFFEVLKPAAMAAQDKYGVPWQVTLAQAALESGWGQHAIGGYNIFGIKGHGPAGSVTVPTQEWQGGRYVSISAGFAKYDNFYQAVEEHGALFHNGCYDKAINDFARNRDPLQFVNDIQGIYATSPTYAQNIKTIMREYNLV